MEMYISERLTSYVSGPTYSTENNKLTNSRVTFMMGVCIGGREEQCYNRRLEKHRSHNTGARRVLPTGYWTEHAK